MGQALWCYDFCWLTQCQCQGVSTGLLCCNCWLCVPPEMEQFRGYQCLKCGGCNQGYGYTCFCFGGYCCIPEWMRLYSLRQSIGPYLGVLGDVQITQVGTIPPPTQNYVFPHH